MTKVVAVLPRGAAARRPRLLQALVRAFPVHFEERADGDWAGLDAVVSFGGPGPESCPCPVLVLHDIASAGAAEIDFRAHAELHRLFHERSLVDSTFNAGPGLDVQLGDMVLASSGGKAVWLRRGPNVEHLAVGPRELRQTESLRDLVRTERFIGGLPLIHFLQRLTADESWEPPPLRAAIQIDDPNLHWRSYGHIRYSDLVRDATERNYHAAMAMIPLDGWFAHPAAVRLFRERGDRVSLLMHGNDHVLEEFARVRSVQEGHAIVSQAVRRIAAFERRTGVPVSRVMIAPHGECSDTMLAAMALTEIEAHSIEWPFWWRPHAEQRWLLAGFEPAEFFFGTPIIPRHSMALGYEEALFRAFLGCPIILTGHQDDLAGGMDLFRDWAEYVNGLGEVRWESLGAIAQSNFATKLEGSTLRIRLFTRHARVPVSADVEAIVVELPGSHESATRERLRVVGPVGDGGLGDRLEVVSEGVLDIGIEREGALPASEVPRPARRLWPILRRTLAESRVRVSACF